MRRRFDAVIIGSGIGGLTCGAFLARAGMRVCVLERHSKIGGYAHNFRRKGFTFESGIHSVPLGGNGVINHLLSLLGVADRIEPVELSEMYHLRTPAIDFTMPARREEIRQRLDEAFPHQRDNLNRLFTEFKKFDDRVITPLYSWEQAFVDEDKEFVSRFHNMSYAQFIAQSITDERLKNTFFGQWPYGGASPDYGGALFYSVMFMLHYRDGTHTLRGGFSRLAQVLADVITSRGGAVLTRTQATSLITEHRAIRAVRLADNTDIDTGLVVSNVSPYQLHHHLLPESDRSNLYRRRLSNLHPSISSFIVYCGLKEPVSHLLPHNTSFWFNSDDFASIFREIRNDRSVQDSHLITLYPPCNDAPPTLTFMQFCTMSAAADWKRDKPAWTSRLLALAERLYPGINDAITHVEAGTPATFERFTGNTAGAIYGFENTKDIYGEAKLPPTTHIANLFQTGHWGKPGCGVLNVMTNGYAAYHTIMKKN
jgi:prolycopene isomerase